MHNVLEKASSTGNNKIMACERGTSFGYNSLVADMRGLPEMARNGTPVKMDATHSVQQPGGNGGSSGGQREFAPVMPRCAVSLGIAGVFIECHEDPDNAPSDGPNMIQLSCLRPRMEKQMTYNDNDGWSFKHTTVKEITEAMWQAVTSEPSWEDRDNATRLNFLCMAKTSITATRSRGR